MRALTFFQSLQSFLSVLPLPSAVWRLLSDCLIPVHVSCRRMLSITQSDVTPRVRLETSMAHMAEKHIDMLGQVRTGHHAGWRMKQ